MSLLQISDDNSTFTANAIEDITAGMLVAAGSDAALNSNTVTNSTANLADGELIVKIMDAENDDVLCVGIALETVSSGATVSVATEGIYILGTQAEIAPGVSVSPSDATDAFANSVTTVTDTEEEFKIGKALTGSSASGNFVVVSLKV